MQFIDVLLVWEGPTHDMWVLKDVVTKRNSLKVLHGNNFNKLSLDFKTV